MKLFSLCAKTKKTEKLWHKHFIEVSVHICINKYTFKGILDLHMLNVFSNCHGLLSAIYL